MRTSIWSKYEGEHVVQLVDGENSNWTMWAVVLASHPPLLVGNRMLLDLCQSCCKPNQIRTVFSQSIAICSRKSTEKNLCVSLLANESREKTQFGDTEFHHIFFRLRLGCGRCADINSAAIFVRGQREPQAFTKWLRKSCVRKRFCLFDCNVPDLGF